MKEPSPSIFTKKWRCIRCDLVTDWTESLGKRSCLVKSHTQGIKFDFSESEHIWGCCSKSNKNTTRPCTKCDHTPTLVVLKPTLPISVEDIRKFQLSEQLKSKPFEFVQKIYDMDGKLDEAKSYCEVRLFDPIKNLN